MDTISMLDVKKHNTADSVHMVIHNQVYDVTSFLSSHPGGEDALLEWAGKDATQAFEDVGHSDDAREQMKQYKIGNLAMKDRPGQSWSNLTWVAVGVGVAVLLAGAFIAHRKGLGA